MPTLLARRGGQPHDFCIGLGYGALLALPLWLLIAKVICLI